MHKKKIAVVLLNLGGPDSMSAVKRFLFNLFYDPNIIRLNNPFRWLIAKFISIRREKKAQGIYAKMGGKSTILPMTKNQADKLEEKLNKDQKNNYKVFVSMRYWHPFADEVIKEIENFLPDEILLTPLYPQFSTTTTKSSVEEFGNLIKKSSLKNTDIKAVCCYFNNKNFIEAHVQLIREKVIDLKEKYRILFSAHSLPEKIIEQGDPYKWQIEETCSKIIELLNIENLDYKICYQSKVGPLKWLSPSTEEEIKKAADDNIALIIVPIAFVSEHSETLVELDIEYSNLFKAHSNKPYIRIKALNDNDKFIEALAGQVDLMIAQNSQFSQNNIKIFSELKCAQNKFKDCFCNLNK